MSAPETLGPNIEKLPDGFLEEFFLVFPERKDGDNNWSYMLKTLTAEDKKTLESYLKTATEVNASASEILKATQNGLKNPETLRAIYQSAMAEWLLIWLDKKNKPNDKPIKPLLI